MQQLFVCKLWPGKKYLKRQRGSNRRIRSCQSRNNEFVSCNWSHSSFNNPLLKWTIQNESWVQIASIEVSFWIVQERIIERKSEIKVNSLVCFWQERTAGLIETAVNLAMWFTKFVKSFHLVVHSHTKDLATGWSRRSGWSGGSSTSGTSGGSLESWQST